SRPDLYVAIASEQIALTPELRNFDIQGKKLVLQEVRKEEPQAPPVERRRKAKKDSREPRILIDGASSDNIHFTLAACCNPVQGDDIIAYVSAVSGTKIHRANC